MDVAISGEQIANLNKGTELQYNIQGETSA